MYIKKVNIKGVAYKNGVIVKESRQGDVYIKESTHTKASGMLVHA